MMTTMPPRGLDNAETGTNYEFVSGTGNLRAVAPGGSDLAAGEAGVPGSHAPGPERPSGDTGLPTRAGSMKFRQQRSED